MQTTVPFILEILIPFKRVACLMNILNDFTVEQIIYESNIVKKKNDMIQHPMKSNILVSNTIARYAIALREPESYRIRKGNRTNLF